MVFEDEVSLSNTASISYKWSPKGVQPKIKQKQKNRERVTVFGCVEPTTGKVCYSVAQKGNTRTFFSFLMKVVKSYPDKKVYMVLDNVAYHHAIRIRKILVKYAHRIELIFLPGYSPDLNPIERIWWYMRKKISHNRYLQKLEERIEALSNFMKEFETENELGKTLSKICSDL